MDFSEKINLIMDELGADNVSIARYGGFDRTSLSRFRNGKRVPGASSRTAGMLVEGIYLYADNENSLEKLCSITGGDPRGTSEEILPIHRDSAHFALLSYEHCRKAGGFYIRSHMVQSQ